MFLGLALIFCGVIALLISIWQYHWTVRYLQQGTFAQVAGMKKEGMHSPVLALAGVLVCIGLFAFVAVALRFV